MHTTSTIKSLELPQRIHHTLSYTMGVGNPFAVASDEYFAAEGQVPAA